MISHKKGLLALSPIVVLLGVYLAGSLLAGDFYRVPSDKRDLNYDKYFVEGQEIAAALDTYHSHNTERLDVEGMKKLLLKLPLIHAEFGV